MQNVTVLCTDARHPVNTSLNAWIGDSAPKAAIRLVRSVSEARGGDFLFLVSCQEIVRPEARRLYRHTLVLHASRLPSYRGMSPHVWQILDGKTELTLSLLNAADPVDSGDIWHQIQLHVPQSATFPEINAILFDAQIRLMDWALEHCDSSQPVRQQGTPTYCRRRTPADSEIDPQRPLADSFDLIRVADPDRYPAFFMIRGRRFKLSIEPMP